MRASSNILLLALLALAWPASAAETGLLGLAAGDWFTGDDSGSGYADGTSAPASEIPSAAIPWCDQACCCEDFGTWRENSLLYFAGDGWRTRADDDYPGNFGMRIGANAAFGWWDSPIRLQLGGSYGAYDLNGRDGDLGADPISSASAEEQLFLTFGVSKRSDICTCDRWAWGLVADFLYDDHFGAEGQEVFIRQGRATLSYATSETDEIGAWCAFRLNWARYFFDGERDRVRGLEQWNLFWHHNWEFGGDTWLYAGYSENPGEWNLGFTGQAPLSSSVALFGGVTYVIPGAQAGDLADQQQYSEEYWNVSFGIVWYPGCKAANATVSGHRGLPLMPVADNGSFLVKAPTGDL